MHQTNHKIGIIAIVGVTIYDGYDGVLYSGVGVKNIVIIVITVTDDDGKDGLMN